MIKRFSLFDILVFLGVLTFWITPAFAAETSGFVLDKDEQTFMIAPGESIELNYQFLPAGTNGSILVWTNTSDEDKFDIFVDSNLNKITIKCVKAILGHTQVFIDVNPSGDKKVSAHVNFIPKGEEVGNGQKYTLNINTVSESQVKTAYNQYLKKYEIPKSQEFDGFNFNNFTDSSKNITTTGKNQYLDSMNFLRACSGIDPVTMDDSLSSLSQSAADFMAAHPDLKGHGMADGTGNEKARQGLYNSNLYYCPWIETDPFNLAHSFYTDRDNRAGVDNIGHRSQIMSPNLKKTGIGYKTYETDSESGTRFAHYVRPDNYSPTGISYAIPSAGDYPIELLDLNMLWSIELGKVAYRPQFGDLNFTVRDSKGKVAKLEEGQFSYSKDWFKVYGSEVVFRPYSLLENKTWDDLRNESFTVTLSSDGLIFNYESGTYQHVNDITYTINFFSILDKGFRTGDYNYKGFKITSESNFSYPLLTSENYMYVIPLRHVSIESNSDFNISHLEFDYKLSSPDIIEDIKIIQSSSKGLDLLFMPKKLGSVDLTLTSSRGDSQTVTIVVREGDSSIVGFIGGYNNSDQEPDTPSGDNSGVSDEANPSSPDTDDNISSDNPSGSTTSKVAVYRIYNRLTGEHLYTTDKNEVNVLTKGDWNDEGIGWYAPSSGTEVYRLYSPITHVHLFTTDRNEVNVLSSSGWSIDNSGKPLFYSGGSKSVYRMYNPGLMMHLITIDKNEYNTLPIHGWNQEGEKLRAQ